jgi:hypothetical protein
VYILGSLALIVFGAGGLHPSMLWSAASILGFVVLSLLVGGVPLRWGLARLKHFEM